MPDTLRKSVPGRNAVKRHPEKFLLLIAWSGPVVYEYGSEGAERSGLFHGPVFHAGEGKGESR